MLHVTQNISSQPQYVPVQVLRAVPALPPALALPDLAVPQDREVPRPQPGRGDPAPGQQQGEAGGWSPHVTPCDLT